MFKRAPGFFDVTTYRGTGGAHDVSPKTVYHNLGVTPELIIVKDLERSKDWKVWTTSQGDTKLGTLNSPAGWASDFQIKDVTSTTFKVGTDGAFTSTNYNNDKFVDTVDWTIDDVDSFCSSNKPDILIIDQLDKVGMTGNFTRTDEKLRAVYRFYDIRCNGFVWLCLFFYFLY